MSERRPRRNYKALHEGREEEEPDFDLDIRPIHRDDAETSGAAAALGQETDTDTRSKVSKPLTYSPPGTPPFAKETNNPIPFQFGKDSAPTSPAESQDSGEIFLKSKILPIKNLGPGTPIVVGCIWPQKKKTMRKNLHLG